MKLHLSSTAIPQRDKGFALVVTLTLMILLTIIAVGLLTLSQITLRSSSQAQASATARNNARLALMVALGELQKSLGPDQSVSAPASAVLQNAERPHLTGAWESWRWTPSTSGGPSYSEKSGKFRRWLVSSEDQEDAESLSYANTPPKKATDPDSVVLVGAVRGTRGVTTEVIADKVLVKKSSLPGKMAWAVFDESTKAAINLKDSTNSTDPDLEIASRTAPDRLRIDVLDKKLSSLKDAKHLISLETATIPMGSANTSEIRKRFHDFTTGTVGLLTDTANGGLKQDLTALFEEESLPNNAFERNTPYPQGFDTFEGAPSWAYIRDHYRKYKNLSMSGGVPTYNLTTNSAQATDLQVDLAGGDTGVNPEPETERLLPTLARFQLVYSVVAHDLTPGRRQKFIDVGKPPLTYDAQGYPNYGVIMLALDPVVTLYNPYDVALDLSKYRIRVWDPPGAVRFTKVDKGGGGATGKGSAVIRNDGDNGFISLAQLQIDFETNPNARKVFTLLLADGNSEKLETSLKLMPGEVKVFSPRVENSWTWGLENQEVFTMNTKKAAFFDWSPDRNFSNVDNRGSALYGGQFGIECAPGWVQRAGLQVDHLAPQGGGIRNPQSRYDFEITNSKNHWFEPQLLVVRTTDDIILEFKPAVLAGQAKTDFQVDILAGLKPGDTSARGVLQDTSNLAVIEDTLRSYRFNFGSDPIDELSQAAANPIISRRFNVRDLLQTDNQKSADGKRPFAILEMFARVTKDRKTDTKPWLYNNFVVEGAKTNTGIVGLANEAYDVRCVGMTGFGNTQGGIAVDPATYRGYYGPAASVQEGCSIVNMYHIPLAPAASLGDLVHANLVATSQLPRVVHAFGNSRAHPLIPSGSISSQRGSLMMDHSYLLNDALWDSYYFSSITDYAGGVLRRKRSMQEVLTGVFDGTQPAINSRLIPVRNPGDAKSLAGEVAQLEAIERSRQIGRHLGVSGPFNVNSTSVDAWRAVLSSLRDREVNGLTFDAAGTSLRDTAYDNRDETPLVRAGKPVAGPDAADHLRWAGFSTLEDDQIEDLAESIVEQIASRGQKDGAPALTLAEFVNRRPGGDREDSLAGILQTAIDNSKINAPAHRQDSIPIVLDSIPPRRKQGAPNTEAMGGLSAEGGPTMVTQGDLMAALAPIATVRGDTFKIRSYGEATDADGKTVLARAWCEAVVQRMPDFVDPMDEPETDVDSLTSEANKTFGRRFEIVSFRWLTEEEL